MTTDAERYYRERWDEDPPGCVGHDRPRAEMAAAELGAEDDGEPVDLLGPFLAWCWAQWPGFLFGAMVGLALSEFLA